MPTLRHPQTGPECPKKRNLISLGRHVLMWQKKTAMPTYAHIKKKNIQTIKQNKPHFANIFQYIGCDK